MYERNDENWRFFLTYRQRLLVQYLLVMAAGFGLAGWLWTNQLRSLLAVPFGLLGLTSLVFYWLEKRTSLVLVAAQYVGRLHEHNLSKHVLKLEVPPRASEKSERRDRKGEWRSLKELRPQPPGFFSALTAVFDHAITHSLILRCTFACGFLIFLMATLFCLVHASDFAQIGVCACGRSPIDWGAQLMKWLVIAGFTCCVLVWSLAMSKKTDNGPLPGDNPTSNPTQKQIATDFERQMYIEGSAACRNYSTLTMGVRTLSKQLLIAYAAGLAAFWVYCGKGGNAEQDTIHWTVFWSGVVLTVFALSLMLVGWHYQSAFTAMRSSLAGLESTFAPGIAGPWTAHRVARTPLRDWCSSYCPFLFIAAAGLLVCLSTWPSLRPSDWFIFGFLMELLLLGVIGRLAWLTLPRENADPARLN